MSFYVFKVLVTALIIMAITETAKFNLKIAALLTAMPIITLLCIFWMYYVGADKKAISDYVISTLKYLMPTIPMFIIFPFLIHRINFYITVLICCVTVIIFIYITNLIYKIFSS